MLTKLHIENFKSIHNLEIELGKINVFIGENGCGKSNILEAVALASAAKGDRLKNDDLAAKGIRVTRPDMMMNSFLGVKAKQEIKIELTSNFAPIIEDTNILIKTHLHSTSPTDIMGQWKLKNPIRSSIVEQTDEGFLVDFDRNLIKPFRNIAAIFIKGFEIPEDLLNEEWKEVVNSIGEFPNNKEGWKNAFLSNLNENEKKAVVKSISLEFFKAFQIYEIQTNPLRGFNRQSYEVPGRNGENLDLFLEKFHPHEWNEIIQHSQFISWLDEAGIIIDKNGELESKRLKLRSDSKLYFRDKFMQKKNNVFSVENANEGALHILFYLSLFISHQTPSFFAIDNIENGLNPYLCRHLMKSLAELANKNDKQALITTHNPAILDGLNLHDDNQRLFVVSRNKKGHTTVKRIQLKPDVEVGGKKLKLSELWMRNHLGGIPQNF